MKLNPWTKEKKNQQDHMLVLLTCKDKHRIFFFIEAKGVVQVTIFIDIIIITASSWEQVEHTEVYALSVRIAR